MSDSLLFSPRHGKEPAFFSEFGKRMPEPHIKPLRCAWHISCSWIRNNLTLRRGNTRPAARGKGVHDNTLLPHKMAWMDAFSGHLDACAPVRVRKA